MFHHTFHKRVRYAETDQMGYLYYGHYPYYYEIGRVEALRSIGVIYKKLEEEHNLWLPVLQVESKYLQPAYYDENIRIETFIKELPRVKIRFEHIFYNESNHSIHEGKVTLCFLDALKRKPTKVPNFILQKLSPYFE